MFEQLTAVDCSEHVDKKDTGSAVLSYLSWAWAWDYFKKAYPDAKYEIKEWDGKPYLFDEKTGYMVQTSITAGGETHCMWLPVMDGSNHAMMDKMYQIQTKYKTINVAAATMFDINKNIMRCLVKNMAMFGLGLYIYAGEDLPSGADSMDNRDFVSATSEQIEELTKLGTDFDKMFKTLGISNLTELSEEKAAKIIAAKKAKAKGEL